MPYLPFLDEEKKKADEANGQVNISGASNTINQASQNVAAPKPVGKSGSWTNLQSYLDANKDNAESMGNTIASNISNTGNEARQGIQDSQNDFNTKVEQNTLSNLGTAKADADNIVNKAKSAGYDSQIDDNQVNRFKDVSTAEYKGPNTLDASDYYQNAQSKINKSNEYKSNAQSDEGRFNILQEMFARPTYNQGQKSLDNLLIQGNNSAKSNIQNSANSLNDIQGKWDQANTDAANLAQQRTADINDVRNYSQNALTNNRNLRTSEVDADLKNINNQWNNEYNQYNDLLNNFKGGELSLSQEQANKLALSGDQRIYNILNGVSPSAYLDLKAFDANKVVDKNQFAQLAALDKLANQFGLGNSSKFSDFEQAGTLGLNNNFDASRFGQAANSAQADFTDYAKNANATGTGSKSESIMESNMFGGRSQIGTAYADSTGNQTLENYLAGNGPSLNTSHYTTNSGGQRNQEIDRSVNVAESQVKDQIYSQIMQMLAQSGHANQVKIK